MATRCGRLPVFLLLLLLPACAGQPGPAPVRVEKDTCEEVSWDEFIPESDAEYHYFTGLSEEYHGSERDAQDAAEQHATNKFVKFTGARACIVHEYIATITGRASEILDPRISEKDREKLVAEAWVSHVKAKEYCNVERILDGRLAYKVKVLVKVPLAKAEEAKQWTTDRQKEREQEAIERAGKLAVLLDQARQAEPRGRPMEALSQLLAFRDTASGQNRDPCGTNGAAGPGLAEVEAVERTIVSRIRLENASPQPLVIDPEVGMAAFAARVLYDREGEQTPVAGVPVVFRRRGAVKSVESGDQGEARLVEQGLAAPGHYELTAAIDAAALKNRVSSPVAEALSLKAVAIPFEIAEVTLDERARRIVQELKRQVERKLPRGRIGVALGHFTYGDTGAGGVFADRFREMIGAALAKETNWEIRKPERRLTRSFEGVSSDSPGAIAQAATAEAVLSGRYFEEKEWVVLTAELLDDRNVLLGSTISRIPARSIAKGDLKPPSLPPGLPPGGPASAFRLDLWIDKGNGAVYHEGEEMTVSVIASEDCYLKLVYVDAENKRIVVFPNAFAPEGRIRGGRVQEIPPPVGNFRFRVKRPFGTEMLIAFASTQPFPPDVGKPNENGTVLLDEPLDVIARRHRGIEVEGAPARRAEARVTLTTVAAERFDSR
jgi:hypothetical protein